MENVKSSKKTLKLTDLELLALMDILDTYSALSDGIMDDGTAKKDLRKVDKMLKKNGYKRQFK
jgi:hypothetical protein